MARIVKRTERKFGTKDNGDLCRSGKGMNSARRSCQKMHDLNAHYSKKQKGKKR